MFSVDLLWFVDDPAFVFRWPCFSFLFNLVVVFRSPSAFVFRHIAVRFVPLTLLMIFVDASCVCPLTLYDFVSVDPAAVSFDPASLLFLGPAFVFRRPLLSFSVDPAFPPPAYPSSVCPLTPCFVSVDPAVASVDPIPASPLSDVCGAHRGEGDRKIPGRGRVSTSPCRN